MIVTALDAQLDELPARMPSPFGPPHPLARRAAEQLRKELPSGLAEGKMFGVLVVKDSRRAGFLRAFSGMFDGSWQREGFAPPVFDLASRDAFWPAAEQELAAIASRIDSLDVLDIAAARGAVAEHRRAIDELRARHRERRRSRHLAREQHDGSRELDQQSRGDAAERRRLLALGAPFEEQLRALELRRAALVGERAARSRELLVRIFDTYRLSNARGEVHTLRDVFAPAEPPGGSGDCAAPKLLAYAYRHGLRPIALAELWIGPSPATGGRHDGVFYPPCRGKCEPILAHMLAGLDVEPPPTWYGTIPADEPHTMYEDDHLLVVTKPAGLLSVPGKQRADSLLARLRARHAQASLVHRIDLDASGLLVAAKDPATHRALQAQFARREIDKRYIAWLDGTVRGEAGRIELALRVDLDDRPRQIVDAVHGRSACTDWTVVDRIDGRTRVALFPRTGRSHQLRVHAACGLGAPIVGDRLYGRPDPGAGDGGWGRGPGFSSGMPSEARHIPDARLMLHAEALAFVHPHTQRRLAFEQLSPF